MLSRDKKLTMLKESKIKGSKGIQNKVCVFVCYRLAQEVDMVEGEHR
jgi:hypothetical protein